MPYHKVTAPTISEALKQFLAENNISLDSAGAGAVFENMLPDRKEYTLELFIKTKRENPPVPATDEEREYAENTVKKLLGLMGFSGHTVESAVEQSGIVIKINTPGKDGLLIGKNGQNILSLQYLLSIIIGNNLKRHIPVIVDAGSYREKRTAYLRSLASTLSEKALDSGAEILTELLPSYERKLIHESINTESGLKTFSIGKGPYKKVLITPLL